MKEIGGFFELEVGNSKKQSKLKNMVNNGRNALGIILEKINSRKVYVPDYICGVVFDKLDQCKINYDTYEVDINFNPIIDFKKIQKDDVLIYVNYFGICSKNVREIMNYQKKQNFNLIIDSSQAFYFNLPESENLYMFNSARKFFGVPDGSIIFGNIDINLNKNPKILYKHLIDRIEFGPEKAYEFYKQNEMLHDKSLVYEMSNFTKRILMNIDHEYVISKRVNNFNFLNEKLKLENELLLDLSKEDVPLVYPLLNCKGEELKEYLISHKIFIPTYWENTKKTVGKEYLTKNLVGIPIDQRYDINDMEYILNLIDNFNDAK